MYKLAHLHAVSLHHFLYSILATLHIYIYIIKYNFTKLELTTLVEAHFISYTENPIVLILYMYTLVEQIYKYMYTLVEHLTDDDTA